MDIRTFYNPPPIPVHGRLDWEAVDYDTLDEDSLVGRGPTKEAAIEDLKNQMEALL
jgi:hypothetical protein